MKYTTELQVRGLATNVTSPRDDLFFTTNEDEITRICNGIGWLRDEDTPTAMWVEIVDGDYGDVFCTFSNLPSSIFNTVYEVIRKYESVLGPDYDHKLTEHGAEIVNMPVPIRASLQDLLGPIDTARLELHALCQVSNSFLLANLYHELTAVADKIYQVAYVKERD